MSWYKESYTALNMADMRMRSSTGYPGAAAFVAVLGGAGCAWAGWANPHMPKLAG